MFLLYRSGYATKTLTNTIKAYILITTTNRSVANILQKVGENIIWR